jgi:hypothetical protein
LFECAAFKVYLSCTLNVVDLNTEKQNKTVFPGLLKKYLKRLTDLQLLQQRRLLTFFFFVVISAGFWFVRSLGEEYEDDVTYPVRYMSFPENKVLVGNVPDKLHLRVRARGFSILKSKLNLNIVPLKFNVSSFSLNSTGTDTFYIVTATVKELLSTELDQITILDISPDTLFFRFSEVVVKKVPVLPVLDMHDKFFQKQFMLNGSIRISPDSIIISGPGSVVHTIGHVSTEPINYTNLSDTVQLQSRLENINMVAFSQQNVQVSIPVDRFTEVDENLTIVPVNVPDSLNMIAIPGQVTITFNVCLSNYNKLIKNPPVPKIDYNVLRENQAARLTVFLTDTPEFISNVRFNPAETEFLITRK